MIILQIGMNLQKFHLSASDAFSALYCKNNLENLNKSFFFVKLKFLFFLLLTTFCLLKTMHFKLTNMI